MQNARKWLIPLTWIIVTAVVLVTADILIFGRSTAVSHLAFWPVFLVVALFVGGGVYFWVKDDKPFAKKPTANHPPAAPPADPRRSGGRSAWSLAWWLLLWFGSVGYALLASALVVALALWLYRRFRARENDATGAALGRLTNA